LLHIALFDVGDHSLMWVTARSMETNRSKISK
jgi:hypothetical protein